MTKKNGKRFRVFLDLQQALEAAGGAPVFVSRAQESYLKALGHLVQAWVGVLYGEYWVEYTPEGPEQEVHDAQG